jgi:glycosyltransferase involved in cell wall biosynthesis
LVLVPSASAAHFGFAAWPLGGIAALQFVVCSRWSFAKVFIFASVARNEQNSMLNNAASINRTTFIGSTIHSTMTERLDQFGGRHPSVDVVIPVRNRARFIGACLDSVRAQIFQPAAVLVVDDGSTDETTAILAAYARTWPKLRLIRTTPRGVSSARNTALAASTAHLVAFVDSDDVWLPEKLARQVALFTPDRPQLGLVHCGLRHIDEHGNPLRDAPDWMPSKRGDIFSAMLNEFYLIAAPSSVVARRDLVMKVGGFDESLVLSEGRDLWMRLARVSHVDYVPDILLCSRNHGENTYALARKNDPELVLFQQLKIWNKWFDDIGDMDTVRRFFRAEALSTSISMMLRLKPDFGLYGRLARSEMRIATRLFSDAWDYIRGLLRFIAPRLSPAARIKRAVAARLILPNTRLLRLAQKFGRFRNVDAPTSSSRLAAKSGTTPPDA